MTEILLYGCIGDGFDGLDAVTLVPLIVEGNGPLDLRINSGGGLITEGLAIYAAIERAVAAGRTVTVYIDGLAASMASVVAMAGTTVVMAENALLMIHNPWDMVIGDAEDMRKQADTLDTLKGRLVNIYARKTGLKPEVLAVMMQAETWLDAATALDLKFVDQVGVVLSAAASVDVSKFGFRKVPEHPLVRTADVPPLVRAAASIPAPVATMKETSMPEATSAAASAAAPPVTPPIAAAVAPTAPVAAPAAIVGTMTAVDAQAAADTAVAADRQRAAGIRALASKHGIDAAVAETLVNAGASLAVAQAKVLDVLAERGDAAKVGHTGGVNVVRDEHDKFMAGAEAWLITSSGHAGTVQAAAAKRGEKVDLNPGEFRGAKPLQLAQATLARAGVRMTSFDPKDIVGAAFTARNAITQGTGDFGVLLENTMHKILQASYAVTPDTWSSFCGTGSVSDFRASKRYTVGSFGALDQVNENGEFKNKAIPDGYRESISITTKGNVINLTRQAIINDDIGAFTSLADMLGRAAKLSIEQDVYSLIGSNPVMGDGIPLFHASHANLIAAGAGTPPTVAAVDQMRVMMASQKDISGNDYLDIRPDTALVPLGLGGLTRIVNGSQYDPNAAGVLQKPNIALGIFRTIVDTPRLAGTPWYVFADKDTAPAIEVAFLNGVKEPFLDQQMAWSIDGTQWKVRLDYGPGAINWRSAIKNVGA